MTDAAETTKTSSTSLDDSYKYCRKSSRKYFSNYFWTVGNISREQRRHVHALTAYLTKALDLMDSQISPIARHEEWTEWRDQLRDGLRGKFHSPEMPAVADTVEKFHISREFLFDIQSGVELAIRCKKFEAFDQWMQMASRIGGSMMLSLVPVLGYEKEDYEQAALACGEAIFLTQLMDEMGNGHQNLMLYAPRMLARKCNMHLDAINPKKPPIEFCRLIRTLISRIEPRYQDAGELVKYLSFDGKRVIRSLLAIHWQMLVKMKHFPELILQDRHQLSGKEMFQLHFKHLMGLEGRIPVFDEVSDAQH